MSMTRDYSRATPIEMRVFDYIVQYKQDHDGNSPSYRQIGDALGVPSTSTVSFYIGNLELVGLIKVRGKGRWRGLEVVGGRWSHD